MQMRVGLYFFFFNDTATTEIYTLSLHDALPICLKYGEGNLYGVHMQGEVVGIYYNKAKLAELGIEAPSTMSEFEAALAAAKAGVIGFSKALAREVGSRGITINVVAPGFIDTDMTRALPEEQREALLSQIPLGRLGQADEVAHAVAFLASPEAQYITGQTLHVNGGMYLN